MKTVWTKGLNLQEVDDIEKTYKASALLRKRLSKLLEDKRNTSVAARTSIEDYDSPSWSYKQADLVGYTRALNEIISLLE